MKSSRIRTIAKTVFTDNKMKINKTRFFILASLILIAVSGAVAFSSVSAASTITEMLFGSVSLSGGQTKSMPESDRTKGNAKSNQSLALNGSGKETKKARQGHTATRLKDGRILLVGGDKTGTAEVFDLASGSATETGSLITARAGHTATLLSDGRVLIVGGFDNGKALASTEIYDAGAFIAGPTLKSARAGHTATVLADGRILIVGGDSKGSVEIIDAAARDSQTIGARLNDARSLHSAALLKSGELLIVGGATNNGKPTLTGEILNLETMQFSRLNSSLHSARVRSALRVLPDGKVQIIGGNDEGSMEIFTPDGNRFSGYAHVIPGRNAGASSAFKIHAAQAETNNVAGESGATATESEVLRTETGLALLNNGEAADSLLDRNDYSVVKIPDANQIFVTGGENSKGETLNTSMLLSTSEATVTTDKLDYPPGETVTISGTNFEPGETVQLTLVRDRTPTGDGQTDTIELTSVANENGSFVNTDYATVDEDWGASFVLTAVGQSSGRTAQTTFTDARQFSALISPTAVNTSQSGTTYTITVTNTNSSPTTAGIRSATVVLPTGFSAPPTIGTLTASNNKTWVLLNSNTDGYANGYSSSTRTIAVQASGTADQLDNNESITIPITATAPSTAGNYIWTTAAFANLNLTGNPAFAISSSQPTVTVTAPTCAAASVTTNPGNSTITYGQNTSFSAAASGNPTPTVQWQQNTGGGFTNISGATNTTLNVVSPTVSQSGTQYRAVFTNTCSGTQTATSNAAALTVNRKSLTPNVTANNKTYDGNMGATIATRSFGAGEVVGTDDVALSGGTATFDTKNVGTGKTVTANGLTLSGTAAGNYVLSSTSATTTANITAKSVTASVTTSGKAYDGNANTIISGCSLTGVITPDTTGCAASSVAADNQFSDKNVGTGKTVTASNITLIGNAAGNYTLSSATATTTASITAKHITGSFTANGKEYDGNDSATVAARSLNGAITDEDVSLTGGTATFANKNVGNDKTVTLSGAGLSGAGAGNYVLDSVATTTANVTAKALTASVNANSKTYDGGKAATINNCAFTGVLAGDSVNCDITGYAASFNDKNAGAGKPVSASKLTKSGTGAGNYTFDGNGAGSADITAKSISALVTTANKTYDGNANAAITDCSLIGIITPDTTGCAASSVAADNQFSDANAGVAKTVTASNITLTDNAAGNYALNPTTATTTASIGKAAVTAMAGGGSATYDGSAKSPSACAVTGAYTGNLTCSNNPASVGPGAGTTVISPVVNGDGQDNFDITLANGSSKINRADAVCIISGYTVTYDGQPHTATGSCTGVGSDGTLSGLNLGGTTHTGAGSYTDNWAFVDTTGNYNNQNSTVSDSIGKAVLTITASSHTVTYGDAVPIITAGYSDFVPGDTSSLSLTTQPTCSTVYTSSSVVSSSPYATSCSGAAADNYSIGYAVGTVTVNAKSASVTANSTSKIYGNAATFAGTEFTASGFVNGNGISSVTLNSDGAAATAAAGSYSIVPSAAIGTGLSNYSITYNNGSLSVNARSASVSANKKSKNYGDDNPVLDADVTGTVNGDTLNYSLATTAIKFSGVGGYPITVTLGSNPNYDVGKTDSTLNVGAKAAAVTANSTSKTYGTEATFAGTEFTTGGFVNGDTVSSVTLNSTGAAAAAAAGSYDIVPSSVAGIGLGNYSITYNNGTLTVDGKALTITANDRSKVYGSTTVATGIGQTQFTTGAGQLVNSDKVTSVTLNSTGAATTAGVNNYSIVPSAAVGTGLSNYSITYANGTLTVSKATLTVKANDKSRYYGAAANPSFDASVSGFKNSDTLANSVTGSPSLTTNVPLGSTAVGSYANAITAALGSLTSSNYDFSFAGGTLNVVADPTAITLDNTASGAVFDCENNKYKATLKDTITGAGISGVNLKLTIGTQTATATTGSDGAAIFTLTLTQAPTTGATESAALDQIWSDTNRVTPSTASRMPFVIKANTNVGPGRDATSLYTGSLWFWTTSSTSSAATLTLSATVKNTGECNGDVTKANVSFLISTNGSTFSPVSGAQNLPVGRVDPNDPNTGTASAISQYNIGNSQSVTLTVRVVVGGYYNSNTSQYDLPITIGKAGLANSLMGGGMINNNGNPFPASGYLGINSVSGAFGSQVAYNNKGINPQGQVQVYISSYNRPDGTLDTVLHNYFIKSNSISELSQNSGSASFGSKTNVSENLPDGTKTSLDGGGTMQIVFTPYGKSIPSGMFNSTVTSFSNASGACTNQQGCMSITAYKSNGGVWYSSSWGQGAGTTAPHTYVKAVLPGGNIAVQ